MISTCVRFLNQKVIIKDGSGTIVPDRVVLTILADKKIIEQKYQQFEKNQFIFIFSERDILSSDAFSKNMSNYQFFVKQMLCDISVDNECSDRSICKEGEINFGFIYGIIDSVDVSHLELTSVMNIELTILDNDIKDLSLKQIENKINER